jgi:hypothetical protein
MKHFFTLLIILAVHFAYAQAPQSIPYQAVVRNTDGTVMSNTALTMTFKIHDGSATGTVVYEESHNISSNAQGLVALNVGGGTPITGTFSNINWGNGAKFLHVLMNAGNGVVDLGTQQMMSVPYALYAEKSGETVITENLQIGQTYGGGKIFYLDSSGKHGLIFADMVNYPQYSRQPGFDIFGEFIGAGKINNTVYLNEISPNNYANYPNDAIFYCDSLSYNGYTDWYLPSSYELYDLIQKNKEQFPSGFYLSSTDGVKNLTPNSTYGDGGIIKQPVLVQRLTINSGTIIQVRFSLGYCFNYWSNCPLENYTIVPIRSF